jgi:hypothetical protein
MGRCEIVDGVSKSGRPRKELHTGDGRVARVSKRFAFPGAPARYTIEIGGKTLPLGFDSEVAAHRAAQRLLEGAA